MIAQRSISRFYGRAGLFDRAFGIFSPRSDRSFNALLCASKNSDQSRCIENLKGTSSLHDDVAAGANVNVLPQFLGNLGMKLGFMKVKENVSPPCAMHFRSFIHSSNRNELETGRNSRSMDFVRGNIEEKGKDIMGGPQLSRYEQNAPGRNSRSMDFVRGIIEENGKDIMAGLQLSRYEKNADIVHIKLIRNNTFVTVTDSKGNKKAGASSGSLSEMKGGAKVSRYAAEATAEHVGRLARNLGLKSVVVKVNGFTYFKKKKQAILNFREGYTFSRGDQNPIVHIEDTTRRPHNGCRLRKKRRV